MATSLFPTTVAGSQTLNTVWTTPVQRVLSLSRGSGATTQTDNTVASLPVTPLSNLSTCRSWGGVSNGALGTADTKSGLLFVSNPLTAVTISGSISLNIRCSESNAMANYGVGAAIWTAVPGTSGTTQLLGYTPAATPASEIPTTEGAQTGSFTPTSRTLANGDLLLIYFFYYGVGTSASGFTAAGVYAGASGATGDTFVTFTETITEYVAPSAFVPRSPGVDSGTAHF